jgi:hypothetical protein
MVAVGDHLRPTDGHLDPGVYRVVGAGPPVALLRVATVEGRRLYSGELYRVDPDTLDAAFEPASNPDAGLRPVGFARNLLQGVYWSFRRFV